MIPSDIYFTPVNFDTATVPLGRIKYVRGQTYASSKEHYPAEVVFEDGSSIDIPLTVEQATERMYRRAGEFSRLLRG